MAFDCIIWKDIVKNFSNKLVRSQWVHLISDIPTDQCPLSGVKRTLIGRPPMSANDAVDSARSAASKCYRLVASKPERVKEMRPRTFEVLKELART